MATTIKCPHCGESFEMSQAFKHEIEDEIKLKIKDEAKSEINELKRQLKEKDEKVDEMRDQEMKLRQEQRKLLEKEKEMDLTIQRKIDQERSSIEEKILKQASDEHKMKDLEQEKKISDLMKALEEAKRKAQQGSQQLQGEVLELDLESTLKDAFSQDDIEPVGKGVKGADVRQIVKSPKGYNCGVILWESKRTKAWTDEWLTKLKSDLRAEKANIPVIVTSALPKDIKSGMGLKDGVWVTTYELALPLAGLLRKNLLDVAFQKAVSLHRGEKADLLYEFITGHEFRQQVEAMVEVYKEMGEQISKERIAFEKIWKAREGQLTRLMNSTVGVVGSIQGKIGQSSLQVKGLDLLEEGE